MAVYLGSNAVAMLGGQPSSGGGGSSATLIMKSITANGTYNASSDSADGYSSVTVNVPSVSSNDFIVTLTKNQQDEWEPDCTYAELYSAYTNGKNIIATAGGYNAVSIFYDDGYFYYLVDEPFDDFDGTQYYDWGVISETYVFSSNGAELDESGQYYNLSLANATASDVANGKVFYNSQGIQIGTASASTPSLQTKGKTYTPTTSQQTESVTADSGYDGLQQVNVTVNAIPSQYIVPNGNKAITENGTNIDVAQYATVSVDVPSSGGASNIVEGTFTTGSSAGVESVNIPYTGSGYPISCIVVVEGGAYNTAMSGWYNSVQRYAVGQWTMTKAVFTSAPSYGTSGTQNQGVTTWIYKNSTSSSTSYTRSSAMNTNVYSSSNASNAGATCIRLKSGNVLSYYVNTSSYGLLPSTTYRYIITYSS